MYSMSDKSPLLRTNHGQLAGANIFQQTRSVTENQLSTNPSNGDRLVFV